MAVLTATGRAAVAAAVKERAIHLAWGRGNPVWETNKSVTAAFGAGNTLQLGWPHVSQVVMKSEDEATTYAAGTDYTVDSTGGMVTRLPAGAIPALATVRVAFKVGTPPETLQAAGLIDEIGRRVVTTKAFVTPDPDGDITVPNGRFAASETATAHLYLEFRHDFDDASDQTIRELGVFVDTVTNPALPPGQRYFEGAAVTGAGILLVLENIAPIMRTPATRETFVFVISF
jgi:hypothetical protein